MWGRGGAAVKAEGGLEPDEPLPRSPRLRQRVRAVPRSPLLRERVPYSLVATRRQRLPAIGWIEEIVRQDQQDVVGGGPHQASEAPQRPRLCEKLFDFVPGQREIADRNGIDHIRAAVAEAHPDAKALRITPKRRHLLAHEPGAYEYRLQRMFLSGTYQQVEIVAVGRRRADYECRLVQHPVEELGDGSRSLARGSRTQLVKTMLARTDGAAH